METIQIKNSSGIGRDTELTTKNGEKIDGVTSVSIGIAPSTTVEAKLEICLAVVDVEAHPLLGTDTLTELAEYYGYELVKK